MTFLTTSAGGAARRFPTLLEAMDWARENVRAPAIRFETWKDGVVVQVGTCGKAPVWVRE